MTNEESKDQWSSLLVEPELPSRTDKFFGSAEDWWNNACLNFMRDGWSLYAIGYKNAADLLVEYVEANARSQDTLVYPVLFLYRQYLELAIKDLIRQGRMLQDLAEPFPKSHRINELWKICSDLLAEISPGDSIEEQRQIGRLIEEFCQVDPTSMAFRYPEDRDGNPSLPGIKHINLRNVKAVIGKISLVLDGADAQIGEYLSIKADMYSGCGDY